MRVRNPVLLVAILASFVAFLDGSVVNVALPAMMKGLHGDLFLQQWVVDSYLITLGSFILIAGSLSDLFGRRKILVYGLLLFGAASLLCAAAPTGSFLIVSRALQGLAGALLVPSSLALITSSFSGRKQSQAIGSWTAWTGIAFLIGPLLGGALVQFGSWRYIFAINVMPIALTLYLISKLPVESAKHKKVRVDFRGALLSALGLAGTVFALIEHAKYSWSSPVIIASLSVGLVSLAGFIFNETRVKEPMLPLKMFLIRNFGYGNIATLFIYSSLSIATFLISIYLQQQASFTPIRAGLALLPVTLIMFSFSRYAGAAAGKYGPRYFMSLGPFIAAAGFLLMLTTSTQLDYWTQLLPGIIIFGFGLATTVAPLTSAILGSIEPARSGIASAVNNAIARIAGLVGIACIGLFTGDHLDLAGLHKGIYVMAILLILGGLTSLTGIRNTSAKI